MSVVSLVFLPSMVGLLGLIGIWQDHYVLLQVLFQSLCPLLGSCQCLQSLLGFCEVQLVGQVGRHVVCMQAWLDRSKFVDLTDNIQRHR